MKKAAKLFGILSAVVLLASGVSMTALAAGWTEDSDGWRYYNKDGSTVTNEWKKSGNNYCWLDSDGLVTTDMIIEDDGEYYYVDQNGFMVTNQWVQIPNDTDDSDGAPDNWYYYMTGNGRAFKAGVNGQTTLRIISGKKYAFGDDGKMLFGWVDENSTRHTEDDAWRDYTYYLGDEDDGAASIGWRLIEVEDNSEEDSSQSYWFHFKTNGKKTKADNNAALKEVTIGGKKYGFNETGRMVFEWVLTSASNAVRPDENPELASPVDGYKYFNVREKGTQMKNRWFEAVPIASINYTAHDNEEPVWFYARENGTICASEFRTINGKKYAFDNSGQMLHGLQAIYTDSYGHMWNRKLEDDDDVLTATTLKNGGQNISLHTIGRNGQELDSYITIREALENVAAGEDASGCYERPTFGIYYFGDSDDGAAKTSTQTVKVEGESFTFYFKKDGSEKGKGWDGIKDSYLYQNGLRIKADKDTKYEAYYITVDPKDVNGNYQSAYEQYTTDAYFVPGHCYMVDPYLVNKLVGDVATKKIRVKDDRIYLINTSGAVSKNDKKSAKDGNENYYGTSSSGSVTRYYSKDSGGKEYLVGESPNS